MTKKKPAVTAKILSAKDPEPFQVFNARGRGIGLVVCDHAGNRVPRSLRGLGIKKADLNRHIGWDIGTAHIGRHIGKTLCMPIVLATYSRLVIDLNRAPGHPECIVETSDHTKITANAGLSKKAGDRRMKEIFWPYQKEIGRQVDRFLKRGRVPLLLAIHSFTPEMDGVKHPWHISVLWNHQEKIAKKIIAEIRKNHTGLLVGENEPYSLKDERFKGSTMCRHAEERGLPYVFVEFRQDLVDTKERAVQWANIFLQALGPCLEEHAGLQGQTTKLRKK